MNKFNHILINKNRGWRGLAEAIVRDEENKEQLKMIFSFSQDVWNDLIIKNIIVMQDDKYYYVIKFRTSAGVLPLPTQQRSVLIKNCRGEIEDVYKVDKAAWTSAEGSNWGAIMHFLKNKNNHTTSDWNCIGVRVIPEI